MTTGAVTIRTAREADAAVISDIYNQGIAERASTFETRLRSSADIAEWLSEADRFPTLVAEADGRILGWARLSRYRPRPCYAGIAEFSIYLDRDARRRGVGRQLLGVLIVEATERGYWKLVARIFPFNTASRALCRSCGFREVGMYQKHAQLDGQWLDVIIVERLLGAFVNSPG